MSTTVAMTEEAQEELTRFLKALETRDITQCTNLLRKPVNELTECHDGDLIHHGQTDIAYCVMGVYHHLDEIESGVLNDSWSLKGGPLENSGFFSARTTEEERETIRSRYDVDMEDVYSRSSVLVTLNNEAQLTLPQLAGVIREFWVDEGLNTEEGVKV